MKVLISILVVLGVVFTGYKLVVYWDEVEHEKERNQEQAEALVRPEKLDGLPREYEKSLRDAQAKGAGSFMEWIEKAKQAGIVKDPRLAWIELDYVLKAALEDPIQAKKVFNEVKARVPENSPVYPRIKSLEKTFE
jgi:hypothetical protein